MTDTAPIQVLVIEDCEADQVLIAAWFNALEPGAYAFQVNMVGLMEEAEVLKKWPDLVLLDLQLPDTNGPIDTVTRARSIFNNCPIVVFSTQGQQGMELIEAGADEVIQKESFDNPAILARILSTQHSRHQRRVSERILEKLEGCHGG